MGLTKWAVDMITYTSNYRLYNSDHMYNSHLEALELMTDENRKKYVEKIKLTIGMSYYEELKLYAFRKIPNSELIKYFQ